MRLPGKKGAQEALQDGYPGTWGCIGLPELGSTLSLRPEARAKQTRSRAVHVFSYLTFTATLKL